MSSFYRKDANVRQERDFAFSPLYYPQEVNHCPGCSGTSWYLGRFSAECAKCHTALPFAQSMQQSMRPIFVRGHDRKAPKWGGDWGDAAFA